MYMLHFDIANLWFLSYKYIQYISSTYVRMYTRHIMNVAHISFFQHDQSYSIQLLTTSYYLIPPGITHITSEVCLHSEPHFPPQVTFKNDQTGEYLFYNVSFKAIPPGVISTIDLTTPVRKSVPHRVSVVNPLPTQVTFHTSVNVLDISLPSTFDVGAESEVRPCCVW